MIISWIVTFTEPMSTLFCGVSLPPINLCASELAIASHLQTPASLKTVRVIFNWINQIIRGYVISSFPGSV